MTKRCAHGVTAESWIDFFAGELDEEAGERLELLLFECSDCATEAERWGAVVGGAAVAIPPVITNAALRALEGRGEMVSENPMQPGEHRQAAFPEGGRLLIHRLGGLDLTRVDRVNLALSSPDGAPLTRFKDVPFERNTGEVIVACQRHFGESFPRHIVFEVERCVVGEGEVIATYSVDHVDWS